MVQYDETKFSPNEFAKLFIVDNLNIINSNLDNVITEMPEIFSEFTERELSEFKSFFSKKIDTIKNTFSDDKLRSKIG